MFPRNVFNLGVPVRRTFQADVTEHVHWGALNRLLLSLGLALCLHSIPLPAKSHISPSLFLMIAFMPRVIITKLRKEFTRALSGPNETTSDLSLQMVQGIDIWKEQRLEEEGIEGVQNLGTVDVLSLAVTTHYPLRTLVDWIDQAILIQRFPSKVLAIRDSGLPISAIEFAWMSPLINHTDAAAKMVASKIGLDAGILELNMNASSRTHT
jgi:hypothetical protein